MITSVGEKYGIVGMVRLLLLVIFLIGLRVAPSSAQDAVLPLSQLEIITVENAGQLIEVATIQQFDMGGRSYPINNLAFSPDGSLLAFTDQTISLESLLHIWDIATLREIASLELDNASSSLDVIAFSPNSTRLATWKGGEVQIWDTQTFAEVAVLDEIFGVRFAAFIDNTTLVTADWDGKLQTWNANNGELLSLNDYQLDSPYNYVGDLSADGSRFAFSERYWEGDGLVTAETHVINASNGEEVTVLPINPVTWGDMYFSGDGSLLITFHPNLLNNQNVFATWSFIFWDTDTGEQAAVWLMPGSESLTNLSFNLDNTLLATRYFDDGDQNAIHIWDFTTREQVASLVLDDDQRAPVAFHPSDRLFAATSSGYFGGAQHGRIHLFGIPPCIVISSGEVNLRAGPGTNYTIVEALNPDERAFVNGQTEDGTWWRLTNGLWVRSDVVEITGTSCDTIPVIEPPFE